MFGYVLSGYKQNTDTHASNSTVLHIAMHDSSRIDLLDSSVRRFWDLESIGIVPAELKSGDPVLAQLNSDIIFDGERYQVSLPWKDKSVLMNNSGSALKRLNQLSRRFERDPLLGDRYETIFREWLDQGIIERVVNPEVHSGPVFYLPHRPVVKESSSTTKIRPVFDASAKGVNGVSLNDCLETGPCLLPSLVEIILRFRR